MRTLLLLLSMTAFAVAAIVAGRWGWFGIDPNPRLVPVWFAAGAFAYVASCLPWGDWLRRYSG